jgi:hypothetical protein|tara:strand:- start:124 stop:528 length:405 start_codon:yes stop_codon:yes gene_type:complete
MIKLKNILNEKTNVELHKVITDKTEPVFMTEEQWLAKWDSDKLNEDSNENGEPLNEDSDIGEVIIGFLLAGLVRMLFRLIKKAFKNDKLKKDTLKSTGKRIQRMGKNIENIKINDPYIFGKGITPSFLKQKLKK